MTMHLFIFTKNPNIPHQVFLPTIEIIAKDEAHAREIADRSIPSVRQGSDDAETSVVGVRVNTAIHWDHPYLHCHLTICAQEPIRAGVVRYSDSSATFYCSECGGDD